MRASNGQIHEAQCNLRPTIFLGCEFKKPPLENEFDLMEINCQGVIEQVSVMILLNPLTKMK